MDDPTLFADLPVTYEDEVPVTITLGGQTYELVPERPKPARDADLFGRATIHLSSGEEFSYLDPANSNISIIDMAYGLAFESRFNGQCTIGKRHVFYSVAEHCVRMSFILAREHAYDAHMHEPGESVCKDIPGPLKRIAPEYKAIEKTIEAALQRKFCVEMRDKALIKAYDNVMLATEQRDLKGYLAQPGDPTYGLPMIPAPIRPWSPHKAAVVFLARYEQLAPAGAPRFDDRALDWRARAQLAVARRLLRHAPRLLGIYDREIPLAA